MKLILTILLFFSPLFGCSRIFLNDSCTKIVLRSMDLNRSDDAKVIISPRGYQRGGNTHKSLIWNAKYGSVITTAFEQGTTDGMNEKGLSAHLHYSQGTEYPKDPNLPTIGIHEWIQYFLDNCATVKEAVALANTFQVVNHNIDGEFWPLFAIVEDSNGETAVFEYIRGLLHIHQGYAFNVAMNDPFYEVHLQTLKNHFLFGGALPIPHEQDSLSRFIRASAFLKESVHLSAKDKIAHLIKIIEKTNDNWRTLWFTVSDLTYLHYSFIRASDKKAFVIDLKKCDFSNMRQLFRFQEEIKNSCK